MALTDLDSFLIEAPHLGAGGVLEVSALWQNAPVTALLLHPNPVAGGSMGHKVVSALFRHARDKGYNVVRYNSRGVGKSSGQATASLLELEDAKRVLRWIETHSAARSLWLGGFSFGGFLACALADALQNSSPDDPDRLDANWTLLRLMLVAPSVARQGVDDFAIDGQKTRIVYSDDDELVDPKRLLAFAQKRQAQGGRFCVIEGGGHFFHGRLGDLKAALLEQDR